jgi:hypothetical protein
MFIIAKHASKQNKIWKTTSFVDLKKPVIALSTLDKPADLDVKNVICRYAKHVPIFLLADCFARKLLKVRIA